MGKRSVIGEQKVRACLLIWGICTEKETRLV